jgi:hypothetical protein
LGGSIRIHKLEEIVRTRYLDEEDKSDVVNRFGLETENSGRILVNLNMSLSGKLLVKLQACLKKLLLLRQKDKSIRSS